jgi:hypothetical protein
LAVADFIGLVISNSFLKYGASDVFSYFSVPSNALIHWASQGFSVSLSDLFISVLQDKNVNRTRINKNALVRHIEISDLVKAI